jgi:hypothetical protein
MANHLYSNDLTPNEQELGFIKVYTPNHEAHYAGASSIVPAVVRPIRDGEIVLKVNTPWGDVEYSHQRFATCGLSALTRWTAVSDSNPLPEIAIQTALNAHSDASPDRDETRPAAPGMNLACPMCSHEFDLSQYYVPFDSEQKCPRCGKQENTGYFRKSNM